MAYNTYMQTVLLAFIAGILALQFLNDETKGENNISALLVGEAVLILISAVILFCLAWGVSLLLQWVGVTVI
jgi:hypothetical protein